MCAATARTSALRSDSQMKSALTASDSAMRMSSLATFIGWRGPLPSASVERLAAQDAPRILVEEHAHRRRADGLLQRGEPKVKQPRRGGCPMQVAGRGRHQPLVEA